MTGLTLTGLDGKVAVVTGAGRMRSIGRPPGLVGNHCGFTSISARPGLGLRATLALQKANAQRCFERSKKFGPWTEFWESVSVHGPNFESKSVLVDGPNRRADALKHVMRCVAFAEKQAHGRAM